MTIKAGKVVDMSYSLSNTKGEILDRADASDPFTYLHGSGQIVPGLETALEGLNPGDKKKVTVPPAEGYGEVDPSLRLTVQKSQFPQGIQLETGMQFQTQSPEGYPVVFTVTGVEGESVKVDGNHPLAGETLNFDVEILKIRDATKEEMEHGHAHGPDGHGHEH